MREGNCMHSSFAMRERATAARAIAVKRRDEAARIIQAARIIPAMAASELARLEARR